MVLVTGGFASVNGANTDSTVASPDARNVEEKQKEKAKPMKELTFGEMFSGIGGFRLGLERSGWKCIWANDIDKYANQIYKKKFGNVELVEGDIREVDATTIPSHTLLTGGFPCPTFSFAGKRKGITESRGTLFWHIYRVAKVKRPSLLLLENVKGLLSNDSGRTFALIIRLLENLGYLIEWQVLNSKYFSVPQNRERVFIVGHLRDSGSRQIFPIGQTLENAHKTCGKTFRKRKRLQVANTLSSRYFKDGSENLILQQHHREGELGKGNFRIFEGISLALTQIMGTGGNNVPMVVACETAHRKANISNLLLGKRIRRLTPIECERLQGFPDNWTEGISDTQRYRLLGNAVTVNVIEFLGFKLKECLAFEIIQAQKTKVLEAKST